MTPIRSLRPWLLALALFTQHAFGGDVIVVQPAPNQELVSTAKIVPATRESDGFRLVPSSMVVPGDYSRDLAPPQVFEVVRPNMAAISVGRLYTSCICVRLSMDKSHYGQGEPAYAVLRNVKATPTNGQMYVAYVQLTSPIRETLRYDTFVASGPWNNAPSPVPVALNDVPVQVATTPSPEPYETVPYIIVNQTEEPAPLAIAEPAEKAADPAPAAASSPATATALYEGSPIPIAIFINPTSSMEPTAPKPSLSPNQGASPVPVAIFVNPAPVQAFDDRQATGASRVPIAIFAAPES